MGTKNYERQATYRKRQAERGFVFVQVWARPHEAELIKGMVRGWRLAETKKKSEAA